MGKSRADVVMVLEEELVGIETKAMQTPTQDFHVRSKITTVFLTEIMSLPVRNMLITWGNMYRSGGALLR